MIVTIEKVSTILKPENDKDCFNIGKVFERIDKDYSRAERFVSFSNANESIEEKSVMIYFKADTSALINVLLEIE